ncbi:MAG: YgcG family protein [Proteobacteria bacterium]|nr:YgcG family protein [Pseudomonadota bacterium]
MRIARTCAAILCACALTLGAAWAADNGLQPIPPFGARVIDQTNTLTPQQVQSLTQQLQALEQRKGSRVAILILPTTQPEDIAQYSIRVTDAWKLSRTDKQAQDGVLFTIAKNDHRVRIDVGRDLEGAIPDAAADRIIREYVTPKFRAGDFYGGIEDALGALTKLIDGESLPPPLTDNRHSSSGDDAWNLLFPLIFIALWLRAFLGRLPSAPRAGLLGAACGGIAWLMTGIIGFGIGAGVIGLLIGWLGGSGGGFAGGGGFGGWSGGGWSSGSSGGGFGGGFSGGSSGGFSGGGASGSW